MPRHFEEGSRMILRRANLLLLCLLLWVCCDGKEAELPVEHEDEPGIINEVEDKDKTPVVDEEVIVAMRGYAWPGNVRELKNFIERLVILVPDPVIKLNHLPSSFVQSVDKADTSSAFDQQDFRRAKIQFEKEYLRKKLRDYGWNVSRTAKAIGIERSHLHRKIKAYGVAQSEGKGG